MGSFSLLHWLIVLFVVLLLFGSRRLPNLMTDLASAVRAFRKGLGEEGEGEPNPQPHPATPKRLSAVVNPEAEVLEVQAVVVAPKKTAASKTAPKKVVAKPAAKSPAKSASKPAAKAKPAAVAAAAASASAAKKPASSTKSPPKSLKKT
jgi:sec-independent protein translocase protein TatA